MNIQRCGKVHVLISGYILIRTFLLYRSWLRDFPAVQRLRLPSRTRCAGLIPGRGDKIPHGLQPKNENMKQKQYCNKFNNDFKKNALHKKDFF